MVTSTSCYGSVRICSSLITGTSQSRFVHVNWTQEGSQDSANTTNQLCMVSCHIIKSFIFTNYKATANLHIYSKSTAKLNKYAFDGLRHSINRLFALKGTSAEVLDLMFLKLQRNIILSATVRVTWEALNHIKRACVVALSHAGITSVFKRFM